MATDMEAVYEQFYHYDFTADEDYQKGLQQVFEQYVEMQNQQTLEPMTVAQIDRNAREILTMQARVYFFCEKTDNILSLDEYEKWKRDYESRPRIEEVPEEKVESAPYSSNYEQLVDLILNDKPVPGIKQIPKVVLDPNTGSKHVLKERRKPWEQKETEETQNEAESEKAKPETAEAELTV